MVDPNEVFPAIGSVAMRRQDTPSPARDAGREEEEMGARSQLGKVSDEEGTEPYADGSIVDELLDPPNTALVHPDDQGLTDGRTQRGQNPTPRLDLPNNGSFVVPSQKRQQV